MLKEHFGRVTDPVLITLSVTLAFLAQQTLSNPTDRPWTVVLFVVAGVFLLTGIIIRNYWKERTQRRADKLALSDFRETISHLESQVMDLTNQVSAPPIRIITKDNYADLIRSWNESGEGHLLLFNIELQSFQTIGDIENTWGDIGHLTNIKNVQLLLPKRKVRRWERVVQLHREGFFAAPQNCKFTVCEFDEDQLVNDPDSSTSIGFALYRYSNGPLAGECHSTSLVFVMSRPFSELRAPKIPQDDNWWDYHHIIAFFERDKVGRSMEHTWNQYYNGDISRSIQRVIVDTGPLQPVEPAVLFDRLKMASDRKLTLLKYFEKRNVLTYDPPLMQSSGSELAEFTITYDNGDSIRGRCRNVSDEAKPAIVWVGGFTEKRNRKLPELFERTLKDEAVVQFYYDVSSPAEHITLARYKEDMQEVLRFASRQRAVAPGKIVLMARSINGLIAPLVVEEEGFSELVAGLILIAPVFDLEQMINNYRASLSPELSHVQVEKCWRASPDYTADKWENPENGWLRFFDQNISLALFADIIRNERDAFSISSFCRSMGNVSQRCPVFILSNPDDPVTGSSVALDSLAKAAASGDIVDCHYQHIPIQSAHWTAAKRGYPFAPREELRETKNALRSMLSKCGIVAATEPVIADSEFNVA